MKKSTSSTVVLIAFAAFIGLGLFEGLFGVAWPSIRETFGQSNDALGVLFFVSTLSGVVASAVIGWLIDKRGLAFVLTSSFLLMLAGLLLIIGVNGWWLFVVAAAVRSMGMGLLDGGMNTFGAIAFRPRIMNWLHASFGIGTTIGAFVMTGVLALDLNWRVGVGIMAAYMAVMMLVFIRTHRRWVYGSSLAANETASTTIDSRQLRQPLVIACVLFFFLNTGLEVGIGTWAFTLLTESRGIEETTAGTWASLFWGAFTVGRILLGFIEQNQTRLIRIGTVGAFLGTLLLFLNPLPILNLVSLMLIGVALAPIFPAQISLTPLRVGKTLSSRVVGYQVAAAAMGAAIFPGLAGWLGDQFSLEMIAVTMMAIALLQIIVNEVINRLHVQASA